MTTSCVAKSTVGADRVIVFLDFDGVTHCRAGSVMTLFDRADALAAILEPLPVRVIVSSSWREAFSLDEVREMPGPRLGALISGATPWIRKMPEGRLKPRVVVHGDGRHRLVNRSPRLWYQRYDEILAWLDAHGGRDQPWIAVDDFAHFFPLRTPQLFLVDNGLEADDLMRLRNRIAALASDLS